MWDELLTHINNAAEKTIPKINYKIILSFRPSTKTKNLQIIYINRHNTYKPNINEEEKNIFLKNTATHKQQHARKPCNVLRIKHQRTERI